MSNENVVLVNGYLGNLSFELVCEKVVWTRRCLACTMLSDFQVNNRLQASFTDYLHTREMHI